MVHYPVVTRIVPKKGVCEGKGGKVELEAERWRSNSYFTESPFGPDFVRLGLNVPRRDF